MISLKSILNEGVYDPGILKAIFLAGGPGSGNSYTIQQVFGVDNLMKILLTLEDGTNTFIISHKPDMLENKLKDKIVFIKKNNFSQI